jgi:ribose transport system ATP-binding protein
VTNAELVRHMVGRQLEEVFPPRREQIGDVVLELVEVGGEVVPESASLTLHRGEILGIGGLCGAGRTETLEVLFDLRPRVRGEVLFRGAPLPAGGVRARWRSGLGLLVEDRKTQGLAVDRSITENVTLPSLERMTRNGWIDRRREVREVAGWIDALAIRCRGPRQEVRALSGGNQQKVALARLLQADADVWLLDEPTRGIDVGSKLEIYHLLDRLAREGKAILLVSSQLPELLGLCDRIAVMRDGVLGPARPAAEWTQESLLHAALEVAES